MSQAGCMYRSPVTTPRLLADLRAAVLHAVTTWVAARTALLPPRASHPHACKGAEQAHADVLPGPPRN